MAPRVDAVRIDDDPAGAGLAEDLGEARDRQSPATRSGRRAPDQGRPTAAGRRRRRSAVRRCAAALEHKRHQRHVDHGCLVDAPAGRTRAASPCTGRSLRPSDRTRAADGWSCLEALWLSDRRLAARPVGAARSGVTPFARRMVRMPRMMVVLPTPGPPVTIKHLRRQGLADGPASGPARA